MNHANAFKLRCGLLSAELTLTPCGEPLGAIIGGELLMPAMEITPQYIGGVKWLPVVVWVNADEVTRCGSADE